MLCSLKRGSLRICHTTGHFACIKTITYAFAIQMLCSGKLQLYNCYCRTSSLRLICKQALDALRPCLTQEAMHSMYINRQVKQAALTATGSLHVLILPVHILGGVTSRRGCLRRSRSALVGIRSPFSSSPRNRIVFMGFLKGSGPFSNAHVLGHCRGRIIIRISWATMESTAAIK